MVKPAFTRHFDIIKPIRFEHRNEWLILYSVQVFMKSVKQDREELLRILLLLVVELVLEFCNNRL